MLRPSYTDLLEVLNKDNPEGDAIGSRYTIVIAAAKRARQLVDHAIPLTTNVKIDKPVSIAVAEMYEGRIKIREKELLEEQEDLKEDFNSAQNDDNLEESEKEEAATQEEIQEKGITQENLEEVKLNDSEEIE